MLWCLRQVADQKVDSGYNCPGDSVCKHVAGQCREQSEKSLANHPWLLMSSHSKFTFRKRCYDFRKIKGFNTDKWLSKVMMEPDVMV